MAQYRLRGDNPPFPPEASEVTAERHLQQP